MSSFHFQIITIITLKNSHFEFLPSVSQFWPVFRKMTHITMYFFVCLLQSKGQGIKHSQNKLAHSPRNEPTTKPKTCALNKEPQLLADTKDTLYTQTCKRKGLWLFWCLTFVLYLCKQPAHFSDVPSSDSQSGCSSEEERKHFFSHPAFLTVSGQLHLEAVAR